jgi:hypothetical protein
MARSGRGGTITHLIPSHHNQCLGGAEEDGSEMAGPAAPTMRSAALFVLTYLSAPIPFLRICHSRRLSAKLELPDRLGRTILQTPTSDKAPRDPLGRDV